MPALFPRPVTPEASEACTLPSGATFILATGSLVVGGFSFFDDERRAA